jgi:RNA-directed DNA polymerase
MNIKLLSEDEQIKYKFTSLVSAMDVADLLEIDYKTLNYLVYRKKNDNYKTFFLGKKSGGLRKINTPVTTLKIIQQKLCYVFSLIYQPKQPTHGFVLNRSIVTNADSHIKKRCILNIDLQDFFPSINFGRVRGMLLKKPYNIPPPAATVLAQIISFNNELPQGAPTSPIVSNMICAKMDSQLQRLAKEYSCTYTRYADDITFSTTLKKFPEELAFISDEGTVIIGDILKKIISENGFQINKSKTKLKDRTKSRLEVTGIIVNQFPNTQRTFIRQIRAMLHSWEKFGLENAQKEYREKYDKKQRNSPKNPPDFTQVIKGKINYLRMIRGEIDPIYRKLAKRYNNSAGKGFPTYFLDPKEEVLSALWVLECDETVRQGTGFMLKNVGLVTCFHVLGTATHAFHPKDPTTKYPIKIIYSDENKDIAILKIDADIKDYLQPGNSNNLTTGSRISIAGYPNYEIGNSMYYNEGTVTSFRALRSHFLISAPIVAGNSGGPILDINNKVVGIAVTGTDNFQNAPETEKHGFIPINNIDFYFNNVQEE